MGTDEQGGLIACIIFLFLYIMAYNAFIDPITQAVRYLFRFEAKSVTNTQNR
jgi:hypothetical protein